MGASDEPGTLTARGRGGTVSAVPPAVDPIKRFASLLRRARRGVTEEVSDAMTLSTVDSHGRPASRVVLLRGFDARGFVFYTNLRSRKGSEIAGSEHVALGFHWPHVKTQIRIEGAAEPVTAEEADAYFASRPRDSQIAAWASDQSRPIAGRDVLLHRFAALRLRFRGRPVPRPPHWSGFRVVPRTIEFWFARPHRLHDRVQYERVGRGWRHATLSP